MTALSITTTQVLAGTDDTCTFENAYNAGATITAGQAVYLDSSTNTWKLADNDLSAAGANARGIALNGAGSGQPVRVQTNGPVTLGAAAAMTIGETYCVDTVAGSIVPIADVGAAERVTILGVASTAAILVLKINATGVTHG